MGLFSSAPPTHFPVVKGRRLDGAKVRFPHDLPADATLLIVAFEDHMDPLSDQWARLAERIAEAYPGRFAVVETPVVSSKLRLLGNLATMGVRGQVDTEAEHDRTIPLFADVKVFRKRMQMKARDVYPILVARDGRIAWRGEGDIDMDEVEGLETAVHEVLEAPVPAYTDHPDVDAEGADDLADDLDAEDDDLDPQAAEPEAAEPEAAERGPQEAPATEALSPEAPDASGEDERR